MCIDDFALPCSFAETPKPSFSWNQGQWHGKLLTKFRALQKRLDTGGCLKMAPVPSNDHYDMNLASKIDWNKKEDDFAFLKRNGDMVGRGTPCIDAVDDHDMMVTINDCSNTADPSTDETVSMNPTTDAAVESLANELLRD
jgi:hypothetical protein